MKFNRADLKDVIRVAKAAAQNWNRCEYVYGSAIGYRIESEIPSFNQGFIKVNPDGATSNHEYDYQTGTWTTKELA